MFSSEVRKLLIQVISSWQVIAVTVVLVIYIFIVNYVARIYHRNSRTSFPSTGRKKNKKKAPAPSPTDELNLDEEAK